MLFSKETLRTFAQSKGVINIEDDALRILSQDLEYRLKEVCQEASKFMLASHRTKLSISDVNYALISRNVEPLFGYDSQETLVFRGLPCGIYYVPDEEFDLDEYLDKPLPKIPLRPYIQSHWLAIEGVQPPIQQNPVLIEKPAVKLDSLAAYQEELELKQQNKHLLTKELSMYFDKILQTMETDPEVAIACLHNESGIQQLVPYFIHHFKVEMKRNLANEATLSTILRLFSSLLNNKFIFVDPYLHEILPPLFSCVVGRSATDDIRCSASKIVKYVYDEFSLKYTSLAPRIINYLKKIWLDDSKPAESQYGALLCLSMLSAQVVSEYIVKHADECRPEHPKVRRLLSEILSKHNGFRSDMEAEDGGTTRSIIAIPKNPESEHAVFLTGLPYCLQKQIGAEEWRSVVQGLNDVIVRKDMPSPLNILKTLFMIPMLVESSSYDGDVEQYLRSVNKDLSSRGIFIRHPAFTGYTELEVEYPGALGIQNQSD